MNNDPLPVPGRSSVRSIMAGIKQRVSKLSDLVDVARPGGEFDNAVGSSEQGGGVVLADIDHAGLLQQQVIDQGGEIVGVEARLCEGMGIGVVATAQLEQGTNAVTVPLSLLFTARLASEAPCSMPVQIDAGTSLTPAVIHLALQLLLHRAAGSGSAWSHYIAALPTEVDTPLRWSEEALGELDGSTVALDVAARRTAIVSDYKALLACRDTGVCKVMDVTTMEDFEWALSMVWSRAFWMKHSPNGEREATFIPYVDLCNHHHEAPQVRPGHFGVRIQLDKGAMNADQQVEISYGNLSNTDLLVRYGFVLEDNPHDYVTLFVKCEEREAEEELQAARHMCLERHSMPIKASYKLQKANLPPELLCFMRISTCTDIEALLDPNQSFTERLGLHCEAVALWSLLLLLKAQLMQYPTSLKHDKALLKEGRYRSSHHELALRHRVSEKSVWSRGLLCVKREGMVAISSMGKLAAEAMSEAEKETVGDILTKIITQPAQVEPAEPELRAQLLSSQADQFKPTLSTAVDIDGR